jgi:CheY-like chemotaxis protein/HPt (histidine-containing phosphotransfer) domain-containing protein
MIVEESEINEFKVEAFQLLSKAEKCLKEFKSNQDFETTYALLFKIFHTLKGTSGMMGMVLLGNAMHDVETKLTQQKSKGSLSSEAIAYISEKITSALQLVTPKDSFLPAKTWKPAEIKGQFDEKMSLSGADDSEGKKILFVDDEEDMLSVLTRLFEDSGWTVETASNGRSGLEKAESFKPDVILSDIAMPTMTGTEFLKLLVEKKSKIPVIFLTGHRDVEKMKQAWAYGAFDFLDKPFKLEEMLQVCESAYSFGKDYVQSSRNRLQKLKNVS